MSLGSCCTISHSLGMNKAADPVTVTSNVDGADVYINGKFVGTTPYTHWETKANVRNIVVKANGYHTQKQKTQRSTKAGAYWNFLPYPLFNWIWGFFLDRSNGTGRKYKQDSYHFQLQRKY